MLCKEVNTTFSGKSLCSISNSALLCTALLKAACCHTEQSSISDASSPTPSRRVQWPGLSPGVAAGHAAGLFASPRSNGSAVRTHSRKSSSGGGGVGAGVDAVDGVGSREGLGRSKPIPIQRQRSKRERESMTSHGFFPNSTCGIGSTSPAYFPQSWSIISNNSRDRGGSGGSRHHTPRSYRSWVIIPDPNDSELESGYEADVERGTHNIEVAESAGEMEDGELKEGELLRSLTSYLVPAAVKQRVWILLPIWYCIDLLSENVARGLSPQGSVATN